MRIFTLASLMLALTLAAPAQAGFASRAAGELTEFLMKKFGKSIASEGAEALTRKIASAAARHGDDVLNAVRKIGPKAIGLADEAGENAPRVLKFLSQHGDDAARVLSHPKGMALFARYGDDAAKILIKHKGVAEPLIENMGVPAVRALEAVGAQNGRRLAMMAGETTPELLGVIAKHGDPAMEFIWRNRGVLAGGVALTAFLANPEPYLNGTAQLVETVAEVAVKPVVEAATTITTEAIHATGDVAREAVKEAAPTLGPLLMGTAAVGAIGIVLLVRSVKNPWTRTGMKIAWKLFAK